MRAAAVPRVHRDRPQASRAPGPATPPAVAAEMATRRRFVGCPASHPSSALLEQLAAEIADPGAAARCVISPMVT